MDALAPGTWDSSREGMPRQPRSARGNAVSTNHRQGLRQRRLSGRPCAAPRGEGPRDPPAPGATPGRAPDRFRLRRLLRAGRARHIGLPRVGHPLRAGLRAGAARFTPDGVWNCASGSTPMARFETTLAQIAHEILGVERAGERVMHGDTALTPYSTGTWGPRCDGDGRRRGGQACRAWWTAQSTSAPRCCRPNGAAVLAGGAVHVGEAQGHAREGRRHGTRARRTCRKRRPRRARGDGRLPPRPDTGTQLCRHAVVAVVDTETGMVVLISHRRGWRHAGEPNDRRRPGVRRHRPGHRHRFVWGDALRRRGPAARFAPWPTTCSRRHRGAGHPHRPYGYASALDRASARKGIGESGAIGPPAAILNAINDALAPLGDEMIEPAGDAAPLLAAIARPRTAAAESRRPSTMPARRLDDRRRWPAGGGRPAGGRRAVARADAESAAGAAERLADLAGTCRDAAVESRRHRRGSAPAPPMQRSRTARCPAAGDVLRRRGAAASPTARCATGARSAAAWRMPTRRPTGSLVLSAFPGFAIVLGPQGERRIPLSRFIPG